MSGKRNEVLDAAIDLLGTGGLRSLTHRSVDDRAGMPQGSTSNYFRSRGALLEGVATRLAERDREDWLKFAEQQPRGVEAFVEALVGFVRFATGPDRTRTIARYALFVEATVLPGLDTVIGSRRADLLDWGSGMLEKVGSRNPVADAVVVADYLDGVILHQLTGSDHRSDPGQEFDPAPGIRAVLGALI